MTQAFPEGYYSGAYDNIDEGDPNDAASFGAHNYTALPTAAVISGCGFSSPDWTNNEVDIDAGRVRLVAANVTGADSTSWDDVAIVYDKDAEANVALTDGDVNHVYVEGDLDNPDTANFVVNTTGTKPSPFAVKIGEVDTANDTLSEQWNLLAADGTLTYPSESALDEASSSLPEGTVVYDRTNDAHYFVN